MVKFVETDVTGLPLKRKQVAQACEFCRKRKGSLTSFPLHDENLSCRTGPIHSEIGLFPHRYLQSENGKRCSHGVNGVKEGAQSYSHAHRSSDSHSDDASREDRASSRTHHHTDSFGERSTTDDSLLAKQNQARFVGDMNPEGLFFEALSSTSSRDRSGASGVGVWMSLGTSPNISIQQSPVLTLNKLLGSYVRTHCLVCLPPREDCVALRKIYFEKVHPIWPMITPDLVDGSQDSPISTALQQAMCLSAATELSAADYLRLATDGPLLSRQEFVRTISTAIYIIIEASLITDKLVLHRLLLVLALWWEPSGPEDAETPSLIYSKAVQNLQSLALHLPGARSQTPDEELETLFCATWAMDKINSAIYGRSCLIHERDIGRDLDRSIRRQTPCFQLLLRVTELVDRTIAIYRPSKTLPLQEESVAMELPVFESMILDAGASRIPAPLLATIEVLYHSVAIVSCRPKPRGLSHIPPSSTNSRRSLSADRITSIVGQEFQRELTYLPIIPYAVSLSLSVAYRKMRYSAIPMFRSRGKRTFTTNCALLKEIGKLYWRASVIANMAEQVLQEMSKAMAVLSQDCQTTEGSDSLDRHRAQSQDGSINHPQASLQADVSRTGFQAPGDFNTVDFDVMPDLDLFGYIDPDFNLGAVDATMEGYLDVGLPSNWNDWQISGG